MPQNKSTPSSPSQDIDFSQAQSTQAPSGDIDFDAVQAGTGQAPVPPDWHDIQGTLLGYEGAKNIGAGLKQSAIQTLHGLGSIAHAPQSWLDRMQQEATPQNLAQGGMKFTGQMLQYLPLEAIPGAPLASAGSALRIAGGGALSAMQADKPSWQDFARGAVIGTAGEGLSAGLRTLAPAMAETAAHIGSQDRGFGRTTGQTLLEQTSGINPVKMQEQIDSRIGNLRQQRIAGLDQASNRNQFGSTRRAHQLVDEAIKKIPFTAPPEYRADMEQVRQALQDPNDPTRLIFSPNELEQIRQGIDIRVNRWGPSMHSDPGAQELLKELYPEINRQIDYTTPGDAKLRKNITDLVPASRRYSMIQRNAGVAQNVAKRISAPTGALTAAMAGGLEGGIGGAVAGLVIPELVSTPSARMAFARGARYVDLAKIPKIASAIATPWTQSLTQQPTQ